MVYSRFGRVALGLMLSCASVSYPLAAGTVRAAAAADTGLIVVQAQGTEEGELSPRYEPVAPEPKSSYNDSYLFAMTRGVADSTIHPAGKVPLFLLTIPLDLALLPFATIAGFFG